MTQIPVLRHRKDVEFQRIAPAGFRILAALDGLTKVLGFDIWITSGTDAHTSGRHPNGEAFDVSVQGWPLLVVQRALIFLRQVLGERFTVLYEVPIAPTDPLEVRLATVNGDASGKHLHIQPKKGTEYPPPHAVNGVSV